MPLAGLALRPTGGERPLAVAAEREPPQGKVRIDILAGGKARPFLDALLDARPGLERDQALMTALAERHAPGGGLDVAGIVRAAHEADH
jgi:hypothetical protein